MSDRTAVGRGGPPIRARITILGVHHRAFPDGEVRATELPGVPSPSLFLSDLENSCYSRNSASARQPGSAHGVTQPSRPFRQSARKALDSGRREGAIQVSPLRRNTEGEVDPSDPEGRKVWRKRNRTWRTCKALKSLKTAREMFGSACRKKDGIGKSLAKSLENKQFAGERQA